MTMAMKKRIGVWVAAQMLMALAAQQAFAADSSCSDYGSCPFTYPGRLTAVPQCLTRAVASTSATAATTPLGASSATAPTTMAISGVIAVASATPDLLAGHPPGPPDTLVSRGAFLTPKRLTLAPFLGTM